jgi:hypothetical protein
MLAIGDITGVNACTTPEEQSREPFESKDGTSIAYERQGSGPAVILVGGGVADRSGNAPLVPELAGHFTRLRCPGRPRTIVSHQGLSERWSA